MIRLEPLLSKQNAPLDRLALYRIQLDQDMPRATFRLEGEEGLLYPLVGTVHVMIDGMERSWALGRRRSVFHRQSEAYRLSGHVPWEISLQVKGYAADCLLVTCRIDDVGQDDDQQRVIALPMDADDSAVQVHRVGQGTHRREVRAYSTPPGYLIHCGETVNIPGGWSSFPDHSMREERTRFLEHEEIFFPITGGYGIIVMEGVYVNGTVIQEMRLVKNGEPFVTPLGSHPIIASPGMPLFYFWAYRSFLQKTYNRFSTDVSTYVK